jgi:hypothetical protein
MIFERYKDCAVDGLTDRSRCTYRHANQPPPAIEQWIVRLEKEYPTLGRAEAPRAAPGAVSGRALPAISTVHALLDRPRLVTRRGQSAKPSARPWSLRLQGLRAGLHGSLLLPEMAPREGAAGAGLQIPLEVHRAAFVGELHDHINVPWTERRGVAAAVVVRGEACRHVGVRPV